MLLQSGEKWTDAQKERANVLFGKYPKIKEAYSLLCSLRSILRDTTLNKETAKSKLHEWYDKVAASTLREVKAARDTIKLKEDQVLNYFVERSTNIVKSVIFFMKGTIGSNPVSVNNSRNVILFVLICDAKVTYKWVKSLCRQNHSS